MDQLGPVVVVQEGEDHLQLLMEHGHILLLEEEGGVVLLIILPLVVQMVARDQMAVVAEHRVQEGEEVLALRVQMDLVLQEGLKELGGALKRTLMAVFLV